MISNCRATWLYTFSPALSLSLLARNTDKWETCLLISEHIFLSWDKVIFRILSRRRRRRQRQQQEYTFRNVLVELINKKKRAVQTHTQWNVKKERRLITFMIQLIADKCDKVWSGCTQLPCVDFSLDYIWSSMSETRKKHTYIYFWELCKIAQS
jgi:hypothetical protein